MIHITVKFDIKPNSDFELKFSSTLNEEADDESWGIQNLVVKGV